MMEKTAIYPGTFDPITNGHVDVIERAASMFDEVVVVIAVNSKKQTLFDESERLEMAEKSLEHLKNVKVQVFQGLVVDFAKQNKAVAIIRGIRAVSDFEYEFQMALMNRRLKPEVSTIFLMPHENYTYLNSSIIREISRYGQDTEGLVPAFVADKLREKFSSR